MERFALFLHLSGALLFAAGIVVAGIAFESARRRREPGEIALLLGLARIGAILVGAGGVALLGGGLWLVALEHDVGYGTGWIDAALALFALVAVLGALGGRRPRHARELAAQLSGEDRAESPELRALLDDPRSRIANYASAAIIPAILALMVFKP
jgi:hypothetical protein